MAIVTLAAIFSSKTSFSNLTPAFNPGSSKLSGVLAVVAVAPWAFVGFDTVPQAAEEFNFSQKKAKLIMVVSILFGAAIYVILNSVTAMVVPDGYANWAEYIGALENLNGLAALPTFNAAHELLGTAGLIFLGIAVLGAILSGICGFYMATSRLLYSMANEKVLPEAFGKLHKKYKTPYVAIIFVMAISLIAPFFGRTALGWIVDMSSLGAAIGYGYTSAAAAKFAKMEGNKSIRITGLLGTLLAIAFAILLLIPIPGLNCSLGKESYICLIIWIVIGAFFYLVSGFKKNDDEL